MLGIGGVGPSITQAGQEMSISAGGRFLRSTGRPVLGLKPFRRIHRRFSSRLESGVAQRR